MGRLLAFAALLLASPAAAQSGDLPVPHGPNDSVLGTAEEFRIDGPARVCTNNSGFDLLPGETFYLDYIGIHFARLVIRSPAGDFVLTEGDAFMKEAGGRPVPVPGLTVRRFGRGKKLHYVIHAPSKFDEGEEPLLSIRGLHGAPGDADILRRIVIAPEDRSCTKRFLYGWFFEDEPAK